MRHQDNAGNEGVIEPGGIQWMTAGSGIVHSEMPEQQDGLLEGFQLWINLPGAHKMDRPAYQEHDATSIPTETRQGATLKVISGVTSQGTSGPVSQPLTDPLYLDVTLQADTEFNENLAADHNAFVYVINGEVALEDIEGDQLTLARDQLAVLGKGDTVTLKGGDQESRFLLVAGKPLNEPVARGGPFVMNTEAEVRQAFSDYRNGNF
jgi:redox-sensitive bicupin YhaK (pirin superfamily)